MSGREIIDWVLRRFAPKMHLRYVRWYHTYLKSGKSPSNSAGLCSDGAELEGRHVGGMDDEVFLRGDTEDEAVFDAVFHLGEYDLELGNPDVIIDAGAHVGLSAIYFASRYPQARVIALEPEPANFEVLRINARSYDNLQPLHAALWSRQATLEIANPDADSWGFRVAPASSASGLKAYGVADLIERFSLDHIDVLKLDVEGAEVDVFASSAEWIDNVGTIIMEPHDRFRRGCTQAVREAVAGKGYAETSSGENLVLVPPDSGHVVGGAHRPSRSASLPQSAINAPN